jgi:hypothetical protein
VKKSTEKLEKMEDFCENLTAVKRESRTPAVA